MAATFAENERKTEIAEYEWPENCKSFKLIRKLKPSVSLS